MNREIKFRGKRIDNGEWVNGYYNYCSLGGKNIIAVNNDYEEDRVYYSYQKEAMFYEVIPETVGQYLEIKDKIGQEIYEGDIIELLIKDYSGEPKLEKEIFIIDDFHGDALYLKNIIEFIINYQKDYGYYLETKDYVNIIGNKFENPELLEK